MPASIPASIELPGRVRLDYAERGSPRGTPVVFLHGLTDSWRSFEPVLPYLPESIHALALTQRGHGDSDRPETGYRTRDFSEDLAAFLDALDIECAVVVGHSMGSVNAMRFAIDHPRRTLGLVPAGAFASFRGNPVVMDFWENTISGLVDPIDVALARDFQQSTLARPIPQSYFEVVVAESLKVPARVWRAACEGLLEDDVVGELGSIEAPTVLLWGDQDGFTPRGEQDALLAAIPGSRLVVYEGAGHALHWEEPARFAADVAAFAVDVAGRQRPFRS